MCKKKISNILKDSNKKIESNTYAGERVVIYGAGNMGRLACRLLENKKINLEAYLDRNVSIKGSNINGIPVMLPEEISYFDKKEVIVAIGVVKVPYNDIKRYLEKLGYTRICYLGTLLEEVFGDYSGLNAWRIYELDRSEISKMNQIYDNLNDELSKDSLLQTLHWMIYKKEVDYIETKINFEDKYFDSKVKRCLTTKDIFVNYGVVADNFFEKIQEIATNNLEHIYNIEPNPQDYVILSERLKNSRIKDKVTTYNIGLSDFKGVKTYSTKVGSSNAYQATEDGIITNVITLDELMNDRKYTFLKVYGFGIGEEVIQGGMKSILRNRPIICINIHHTRKDFFNIPHNLIESLDEYEFSLRLYGYCGSEIVFYAIPKERIINI